MSDFELAAQAKALSGQSLMSQANVVGVGIGYRSTRGHVSDELSVVVMVRHKLPPAALSDHDMVPQELGGVRTDVIEVGDLRPLPSSYFGQTQNVPTDRYRPAPGGVSVGHYQITAGTLGCVVQDRVTGRPMILSNNHVLANSNSAQPGDPILQPGPADGGQLGRDTIAYLDRFVTIRYNTAPASCNIARAYAMLGNRLAALTGASHRLQAYQANPHAVNRVDAALARPVQESDLQAEILSLGAVEGAAPAALGMAVMKSGRTTGYTTGVIQVLDASVQVNYGPENVARFDGQIISSPMSQGGDSGSLVLDSSSRRAVGLLFAGSAKATIFNPIQEVLDQLRIEFPRRAPVQAVERQTIAQRALAVKEAYQNSLLQRPNVVGVGVGLQRTGGQRTGQVGLVVMVDHKVPKGLLRPEDTIPEEIEGVPVDVKEVGHIKAN